MLHAKTLAFQRFLHQLSADDVLAYINSRSSAAACSQMCLTTCEFSSSSVASNLLNPCKNNLFT